MQFEQWEPVYERILEDFGFSRKDDENAAILLSNLLIGPLSADIQTLYDLIVGRDILICGNAPCLKNDLKIVATSDYVIIAADGAASTLLENDTIPEIIVTDLDGDMEKEIEANKKGALMVVHAHGDNTDKLLQYVPLLNNIIATTQATPFDNIYNFGGFSDGDRCAYLAKAFDAASMTFIGFDFEDTDVNPIKKKKLKWARYLLEQL